MDKTRIPVSAQQLMTNLDALVTSVDIPSLQTTVTELGKAFANRGEALGSLLDSSNNVLKTAQQNLPSTIALIQSAATVLDTQLAEAQPLQSFTHSLNLLSQQLKASDGDIRKLLRNGPGDLSVIGGFIKDNRTDLVPRWPTWQRWGTCWCATSTGSRRSSSSTRHSPPAARRRSAPVARAGTPPVAGSDSSCSRRWTRRTAVTPKRAARATAAPTAASPARPSRRPRT